MSTAHRFAEARYDIQLAARNVNSLNQYKSNLEQKYQVDVTLHEFDALKIDSHKHLQILFLNYQILLFVLLGIWVNKKMNKILK